MKKTLLAGVLAVCISPAYGYMTVHIDDKMHSQCTLEKPTVVQGILSSHYEENGDFFLINLFPYPMYRDVIFHFDCEGKPVEFEVSLKPATYDPELKITQGSELISHELTHVHQHLGGYPFEKAHYEFDLSS